MAWYRRRALTDDVDQPRDPVLAAMTVPQAARFVAAAQHAFRSLGVELVPDGDGVLLGPDGFVVNLRSIAHTAAALPERRWRRFLAHHAATLVAARDVAPPSSLDEVRDRLYLRLFDREALMADSVGVPVAGRILAMPAVDHPDHILGLSDPADVERLGGWSAVAEVGLDNLRRLTAESTATLGDDVLVSQGGWFHASRLLVLDTALASDFRVERPAHGVLVAVPTRHLMLAHPVAGPSCLPALRAMVTVAQGESHGAGALSGEVFYWRDGVVEQVTLTEGDHTSIAVGGGFGDAVRGLGLLPAD